VDGVSGQPGDHAETVSGRPIVAGWGLLRHRTVMICSTNCEKLSDYFCLSAYAIY